ncbi:serine hydrolase domain-containing protein [Promicromonospora sp. MS192]|uniref:serine hydrolase domain-containing protein n=1 Tax=Promicromonospora sp. MS192 TaxID=3412684 RepID=UPI003C2F063D
MIDRTRTRRPAGVRGVLVTAAVAVLAVAPALPAGATVPATATSRADALTSNDEAVDRAVDGGLDEYVRVHRTPGLALVTLVGGEVRVRVHGVTGDGAPVDENTPMRIGSMTKAFTALAVLQQVDAGRLALDDAVADVLPELRLADERYRDITVEHLLTHRSGLAATDLEYSADPAGSAAETVARLSGEELASDPGTVTLYSNAGYDVLARLVERTAGVAFDEYLAEQVLTPLGMDATLVTSRCDVSPAGLARGFSLLGPVRVAVPELPQACTGSGGIVSTAHDMAAWLRFQVGDGTTPDGERLLRPESFRAFHDVPTDPAGYGFGWHGTASDGETAPLVGHGGTLATFASGIEFSPVTGTGAVVLANAAGDPMALTHDAIVAADGGTPRGTTNPFDPFNAVVVGIAALVLVAGAVVVGRARRWAARRSLTSRGRITLRLLPLALFLLLGLALPWLGATLMGLTDPAAAYRVVLWLYPAVVLLGAAIALAAGAGLLARLARLRAARRGTAPHSTARPDDTGVRPAPAPRR